LSEGSNCTNSPSLLNLFNTAAKAYQSSSSSNPARSTTASAGCDGEVVEKDKAADNITWDFNKLVCTDVAPLPHYWKVTYFSIINFYNDNTLP
jgi:hypothetical protein